MSGLFLCLVTAFAFYSCYAPLCFEASFRAFALMRMDKDGVVRKQSVSPTWGRRFVFSGVFVVPGPDDRQHCCEEAHHSKYSGSRKVFDAFLFVDGRAGVSE